jgi:signal transduction histidine kinase
MNPAYIMRQLNEEFAELYKIPGHITSLDPLRPENAPDDWERSALEAFEEGESEILEISDIDGESYLRLMQPLITQEGCLKCHEQQGYQLGDVRGGVSVSVPMVPFLAEERQTIIISGISFSLVWVIGISGIVLGSRGLSRSLQERDQAEKELAKRTYDLGERVKELNLLHTLHDIASVWGASLKDILKQTVDIIPSGWQYPEVACARIRVGDKEYSTDNFEETPWNQTSEIIVRGDRIGTVEVGYLEEKPQEDDRLFLEEEYELLATMSQQLGRTIERIMAEDEVKEHSEHLEVMVKERTQELRDAQGELISQERKVALGQIAGSMAHELRHPLGVISNSIYYLQTIFSEADESTNEHMSMISSEIIKADKLISDLLDFSHLRTPKREEMMVSELIEQVLEVQKPSQGVKVSIVVPDDTPLLVMDPGQISQVLANLVENAYHAMPEGGELTIRAQIIENSKISEKSVESEWLVFSIQDTGTGISEENMKKLFDPLFSTKERGIGLGLAISDSIIEANGGSIKVESAEGVGSIFTVNLPVSRRD